MLSQFKVLYARKWTMKSEDGSPMSGCSLKCLSGSKSNSDGIQKGIDIIKFTAPTDIFDKLIQLPATYEIEFDFKSNSDGKAVFRFLNLGNLIPDGTGHKP